MAFNFQALTNSPVWESVEEPVVELKDSRTSYTEDPLVLSCARYRISDPKSDDFDMFGLYSSMKTDQAKLAEKIKDIDRVLAGIIRQYYRGKIIFAKLRGDTLSKFRKDLEKFISNDWVPGDEIPDSFIGMVTRLPYFYENDIILTTDVFESDRHTNTRTVVSKEPVKLTYIRSIEEYQKKHPTVKYWFKDENENRFEISIEKTNSLLPTWEEFLKKSTVEINGNYVARSYDTLEFYQVKPGWKIVG